MRPTQENPKSEARNPKQIQESKHECSKRESAKLNIAVKYPDVIFQTGYNILPEKDFTNRYAPIEIFTKPFTFKDLDDFLEKIQ